MPEETTAVEEWTPEKQMQLILYTIVKAFGKDNVLEIPNTDRILGPTDTVRISWMTSPTSIIIHLAEGDSLEELKRLEDEESAD